MTEETIGILVREDGSIGSYGTVVDGIRIPISELPLNFFNEPVGSKYRWDGEKLVVRAEFVPAIPDEEPLG